MTSKDFDKVAKNQFKICEDVLLSKGQTYAPTTDRLLCFKTAAAMLKSTPEKALWGMLTKHLVSLTDMITSNKNFDLSIWNEKITDSINYLILLKALAIEGATNE